MLLHKVPRPGNLEGNADEQKGRYHIHHDHNDAACARKIDPVKILFQPDQARAHQDGNNVGLQDLKQIIGHGSSQQHRSQIPEKDHPGEQQIGNQTRIKELPW